MRPFNLTSIIYFLTCSAALSADPVSVCASMVENAAKSVGLKTSSSTYLNSVYDNYCEQEGSVKSSTKSLGISIPAIPASLTGGATDAETKIKNFCKNYQSRAEGSASSLDFQSVVVDKSLSSANDCMKIALGTRTTISYNIVTPELLSIRFDIASGHFLDLRGISYDGSVECHGSNMKNNSLVEYGKGVGQKIDSTAGSYNISCKRKPFAEKQESKFYNQAGIVVDTNGGPFNIYWPQEQLLPLTTASQIRSQIDAIKESITSLSNRVDYESLPVGSLIPWFEKDKEPPVDWVKCDGTSLSLCPDLRGIFLMGSTADKVGEKGGGEQLSISISGSDRSRPDGDGWSKNGDHFIGGYKLDVPKPPFVSVLYIKRIRK